MTITEEKNELRSKMDEFKAILEVRELTEEESKAFDEMKAKAEKLSKRLDQIKDCLRDDEGEGDDEATEEDAKRSKPSRSIRALPARMRDYSSYTEYANRNEYRAVKGIANLVNGRKVDGLEGEISTEIARRSGWDTNPKTSVI